MIWDWLELIVRWLHVITGIAWIGSSFFFNWLDSHIEPPADRDEKLEGEAWMVHSGGFYNMRKIQLAPEELPSTLHWVKWEAAWTWISGFVLLAIVYYMGAHIYLIDATRADLGQSAAIAISLASLIAAWAIYDRLWMSDFGRSGWPVVVVSCLLLVLAIVGYMLIYSGRGAYIHVGAMLGTIMAANVWMRIIPAQRELVAATGEGRRPDPAPAARAKQRSLHNNYLTLPVVLVMISNHYPQAHGHAWSWLILVALIAIGFAVRHFFNLRNEGRPRSGLAWAAGAAAGMALVIALTMPRTGAGGAVSFAEIEPIVDQRCAVCHSATPTFDGIEEAPKQVVYDTPADISRFAPMIAQQAVHSDAMPPGNITEMTAAERELLARWIAAGAKVE